eukprot:tig00020592_g11690.t1
MSPAMRQPVASGAASGYSVQAFCPRLLLSHVAGDRLKHECDAVVALFDLTGFSDLCSRHSGGESDIEGLSSTINDCFADEIRLIEEFGGDILSFMGDGVLAIWPVDPHVGGPSAAGGERRPEAVPVPVPGASDPGHGHGHDTEVGDADGLASGALALRAAAAAECSLRVQQHFAGLPSMHSGIRLRVALSAGPLRLFLAGIGGPGACDAGLQNADGSSVPGRLVFFVAGAAVTEAGDALNEIGPGQVALCPSLLQHLPRTAVVPPPPPSGRRSSVFRSGRRESLTASRSISFLLNVPPAESGYTSATDGYESGYATEGPPGSPGSAPPPPPRSPAGPGAGKSKSLKAMPRSRSEKEFGVGGPGAQRLGLAVIEPPALAPLAEYARDAFGAGSAGSLAGRLRAPLPELRTPEHLASAGLYVPYTVRARLGQIASLGAGLDPTRYLSEFRSVSVLFLKLDQAGLADMRSPGSSRITSGNLHPASPPQSIVVSAPQSILVSAPSAAPPAAALSGLGPAVVPQFSVIGPSSRRASTVSASGGSTSVSAPLLAPAVRRVVKTFQALLYSHEGSLRQVLVDDKGMVFIGIFGLYPMSHDDDPARCVSCALDLRKAMLAAGVETSIGCTTGLAFCTFVGSPSRCEFSVFGNVINKAARLMGKAGVTGAGILADEETRAATAGRVDMEPAGEFLLKGFPGQTAAFRPVRAHAAGEARQGAQAPGSPGDDPRAVPLLVVRPSPPDRILR